MSKDLDFRKKSADKLVKKMNLKSNLCSKGLLGVWALASGALMTAHENSVPMLCIGYGALAQMVSSFPRYVFSTHSADLWSFRQQKESEELQCVTSTYLTPLKPYNKEDVFVFKKSKGSNCGAEALIDSNGSYKVAVGVNLWKKNKPEMNAFVVGHELGHAFLPIENYMVAENFVSGVVVNALVCSAVAAAVASGTTQEFIAAGALMGRHMLRDILPKPDSLRKELGMSALSMLVVGAAMYGSMGSSVFNYWAASEAVRFTNDMTFKYVRRETETTADKLSCLMVGDASGGVAHFKEDEKDRSFLGKVLDRFWFFSTHPSCQKRMRTMEAFEKEFKAERAALPAPKMKASQQTL